MTNAVEVLMAESAETTTRTPAAPAVPPGDPARPATRTILIVEDDPTCVGLYQRCLETSRLASFRCRITGNLADALTSLHQGRVDAILLDLNLRDSSGWTTFDTIRAAAKGAPIVVASGENDDELARKVVRHGAQDFLFKDRHLAGILERVLVHAIERAEGQQELTATLDRLTDRERQLELAVSTLRQMNTSMVEIEKQRVTSQLVLGLAHELKNPLQILRMGLDLLARQKDAPPSVHTVVGDLVQAVQRADRLVVDLLLYGAPRPLELTACTINAVVESATAMLRNMARTHEVDLVLELHPDPPPFEADAHKLEQALLNLVMNAIHATPPKGRVTVRTDVEPIHALADAQAGDEEGPRMAVVEILDTGRGIPPENLPHVFDPFFTGGKGGKGIGLGLSVSRMIVQLHGGSLTLENRPEGGACARMCFLL